MRRIVCVADLIFAEQRQVEENSQRFRISCKDDEFSDTSVQRLGCFVCTLLELLVVVRLLNQIENRHRQGGISEGKGLGSGSVLIRRLAYTQETAMTMKMNESSVSCVDVRSCGSHCSELRSRSPSITLVSAHQRQHSSHAHMHVCE